MRSPLPFLEIFQRQDGFKMLYLARHVNENQSTAPASSGQYPRYHQEIRDILADLTGDIRVLNNTDSLERHIACASYVFSLMNRVPMRNGEVFVSTLCEYAGVPYLGAPPAVRALAEDKHLAKHLVRSLGLPTTCAVPTSINLPAPEQAPFRGPYFVKPRLGAASEHVGPNSLQDTWKGAVAQAGRLHEHEIEALIEQFAPGWNITVPVIGGTSLMTLPPVVLDGEGRHKIITHDIKQQSGGDMQFEIFVNNLGQSEMEAAALKICKELQPVDYARVDFRWNPANGAYQFLEVNICCDISSFGSLVFAANAAGASQEALISHLLAYSNSRQQAARQQA